MKKHLIYVWLCGKMLKKAKVVIYPKAIQSIIMSVNCQKAPYCVMYFMQDHEYNIRIYREEQDDTDSETWQVVVK